MGVFVCPGPKDDTMTPRSQYFWSHAEFVKELEFNQLSSIESDLPPTPE